VWEKLKALGAWAQANGAKFLQPLIAAFDKLKDIIKWIADKVQWLINNISKIPVPNFGSGGTPPVTPGSRVPGPGGGPKDNRFTSKIWDEMGAAQAMGLSIGASSSGRNYGDHGKRPSHAIDVYGSVSAMSSFANAMYGRPGSKDIFFGHHNVWQDEGGMVGGWRGNEGLRNDHMDHVHYSVFAKGGVVPGRRGEAVPAIVHAGETILPTHLMDWKAAFQAFLAKAWKAAQPYLGGGFPNTEFLSQKQSGGQSFVDVWDENRVLARGDRTVNFARQVWDGVTGKLGPYFQQLGLNTILHEWAHAKQAAGVFKDRALTEGGATAFVRLAGSAIWSKLGIGYDSATSMGDPYERWASQILKKRGAGWVLGGQFGKPRSFDRGGWLQPGLTLAYNGTGAPERVGGGGNVTFNFPNYVGSRSELIASLREAAALFQRQNGRKAV
jgi:hypothetical protein